MVKFVLRLDKLKNFGVCTARKEEDGWKMDGRGWKGMEGNGRGWRSVYL
jgi:hypothetical protein